MSPKTEQNAPNWRHRFPDLDAELAEVRTMVLEECADLPDEMANHMHQLIAERGKLLRPAFLLLSSRFGAPEPEKTRTLAAAVEMLHVATLIHDDIIDDARIRRGLPAFHTRYGRKQGVLMGDFLFSRSFLLASRHSENERTNEIARVISQICNSEIMQHRQAGRAQHGRRDYLRRIAGKTAALFAVSCHVGSSESGCDSWVVSRMRRIGYCVGMAFQITDDVLDLTGSSRRMGKQRGTDLKQGIFTLPILEALDRDDGYLARLIGKRRISARAVGMIARMTEALGGIEAARQAAATYTERALREIRTLPDLPARTVMESVTSELLARQL